MASDKHDKSQIRHVSLFSGCGGLDLGFEQAGFTRVWANDFDKDAQAVYALNLGEIDGRDIRDVDVSEIPECDILTAGFPCQPFSNAGNRKGVQDSRGMLFLECFRIIEAKMPKVVLFENVKGLLSTKDADGRKLIDVIVSGLESVGETGYDVKYELLNASDYGVPQNRQRVILVGIRKDLKIGFVFPAKQEKKNLTLRNILDIPADVPNQVDWQLSPQAMKMIANIPEGGSWKDIPYEDLAPRFQRIRDNMQRYRSPNFYRRFSRDEINGTITASAQPENCGIIHPIHNRRYTIREIARIQTFPDDFLFIDDSVKNVTAMYKVIGNAVPAKLSFEIAKEIHRQVFSGETMNVDKAYILGLVIGGGHFGHSSTTFEIQMPYKQWGSVADNPERAGKIGSDILKVVKPMLKSTYNLDVSYDMSPKAWTILCTGDLSRLTNDLLSYGIRPEGELRKTAEIGGIVLDLVDANMKRRFVAGLADTIGSTAKSHRRFTDDIQILSFEINGFHYKFACELCQLLHSIGCYPDQILWNHPNFHSSSNPYYKSWKKGFKIRVELDQYAKFGAFLFRTKAESARDNIELQGQENVAIPCMDKGISATSSCVHTDENSTLLPENIRGGHYLHSKHVCAVLGCPYAPYEKVDALLEKAVQYINPFPIMLKGRLPEIEEIIKTRKIYSDRTYSDLPIDIAHYYGIFRDNKKELLFGHGPGNGYPINLILQGIAFLLSAEHGDLNGKRVKGSFLSVIEKQMSSTAPARLKMRLPDRLTPLILQSDSYAVMICPENPAVYSTLLSYDPGNKYKLLVRPIEEADLIAP